MDHITPELRSVIPHFPLGSQGLREDAKVLAKFFFPVGRYTFIATEAEEQDILFFRMASRHSDLTVMSGATRRSRSSSRSTCVVSASNSAGPHRHAQRARASLRRRVVPPRFIHPSH
jgi:hypothetical protein